jgi:hypothetical protein
LALLVLEGLATPILTSRHRKRKKAQEKAPLATEGIIAEFGREQGAETK